MPEATEAAEPDLAMFANAQLHDRGPRYTETPPDPYAADAPYIAEPWIAVGCAFRFWRTGDVCRRVCEKPGD